MKTRNHFSMGAALSLSLLGFMNAANAQTVLTGNLTADNAFFAYISTDANTLGTLIASGNSWQQTFAITPTTLAAGTTYYLNIEAINYGSEAGILADLSLSNAQASFSNGGQGLLTNTANWLGSYNSSNYSVASQPWVTPTGTVFGEGLNGVSPWGTASGVSSGAQWIWASDANSAPGGLSQGGVCQYCTVDFSTTITTVPVPEPQALALTLAGITLIGVAVRRKGQC